MTNKLDLTWDPDPNDIIMLINQSSKNYILDLPTGRYRLDAGRKMRTLVFCSRAMQLRDPLDYTIVRSLKQSIEN